MRLQFTLFVLLASLPGCKKDYPQCDQFVDLAMKCDADLKSSPSDERKQARVLMGGMCEEAFRNDTSSVSGEAKQLVTEMYAELRERADCAATQNTCEHYSKCTENN